MAESAHQFGLNGGVQVKKGMAGLFIRGIKDGGKGKGDGGI